MNKLHLYIGGVENLLKVRHVLFESPQNDVTVLILTVPKSNSQSVPSVSTTDCPLRYLLLPNKSSPPFQPSDSAVGGDDPWGGGERGGSCSIVCKEDVPQQQMLDHPGWVYRLPACCLLALRVVDKELFWRIRLWLCRCWVMDGKLFCGVRIIVVWFQKYFS